MTTPAPTVGIIGLGYGRAHISAFQAHGCPVVALCQRDRTRAEAIAKRYGVERVFDRWEDLLERVRPEIVVIATPPHLHHAIALRAFAAGAHVLCEKPLAMTATQARAMVEAARHAGRVAMTDFNWRFPAAMQEFESRVRAGALGRVFHLGGRWLGSRWAAEDVPPTWRMDRAQAGHGAMGDMGVHFIDLVRLTFGEFRRVLVQMGIAYPARSVPGMARPTDADDFCTMLGELTTGAQVTLTVSRVAHGTNEHTLEAYGSRGALVYRLSRDRERWWTGELRVSEAGGALTPVAPGATLATVGTDGDPLHIIGRATIAPLVARLLEGIRTGTTPSPSFEDGLRAQSVLDAVAASAAGQAWVDVPTPD